MPAVNQIEVHPYFTNEEVRAFGREQRRSLTEAWSPIAQGGVLDDEVVRRVADAVRRTPAQVVLRWHIQRGDIVFPKSVTPARMEENFALFDFELDDEAMQDLSHLNRGEAGPHRAEPGRVRLRPGLIPRREALEHLVRQRERRGVVGVRGTDPGVEVEVEEHLGHALLPQGGQVVADGVRRSRQGPAGAGVVPHVLAQLDDAAHDEPEPGRIPPGRLRRASGPSSPPSGSCARRSGCC